MKSMATIKPKTSSMLSIRPFFEEAQPEKKKKIEEI